jgi:hypothetical protein
MGDSTSSYATAGIALRVSGALKPHHHDKMETPSVGSYEPYTVKIIFSCETVARESDMDVFSGPTETTFKNTRFNY